LDLILWRHAESSNGDTVADIDRDLTDRGRQHAMRIAEWLREQRLGNVTVLSSPARRALETAAALGMPVTVKRELGIGASAADLIGAAGWPDGNGTTVLVAHQPSLGRLAALLLAGKEADWTIKKAGAWWFSNRVRRDETQTILRAVCNP